MTGPRNPALGDEDVGVISEGGSLLVEDVGVDAHDGASGEVVAVDGHGFVRVDAGHGRGQCRVETHCFFDAEVQVLQFSSFLVGRRRRERAAGDRVVDFGVETALGVRGGTDA